MAERGAAGTAVRRRVVGVVCIALMLAAWVLMSEYMQAIEQGTHTDARPYYKPLFMNYFVQSTFSVGVPVWAIWHFLINRAYRKPRQVITRKLVLSALWFTALLSVCSYLWYASLGSTSIAANTAIYNSNSIFVFVFAIFLVKERITLLKVPRVNCYNASLPFVEVLAVLLCIGGVCIITLFGSNQDENGHRTTVTGAVLCVLAAIGYAFSDVLYDKFLGEDEDEDEPSGMELNFLWIGFMGLATFFTQWPALILFHYAGWEVFELPSLPVLKGLVANAALDTILNTAIYVGIAYTSALFISVGQVLIMPASMLADWVWNSYVLPWPAFGGVALVIGGFAVMVAADYFAEKEKNAKDVNPESTRLLTDVDSHQGEPV